MAVWALIFTNLGRESLLGDEALYAATAYDSADAGPWFPLVYDGEPYTGKPPLGIWMQRAAFAILGPEEIAARLPSAVLGALALGIFAGSLARRQNVFVALVATALLGTGHFLLIRHGLRQAVFEGPLLLATTGAILSLTRRSLPARPWSGAASLCAFGAAIKGPIGPAMLLAVGITYAFLAGPARPPRFARHLLIAVGAGGFVCVLWMVAVALWTPADPFALVQRDIWERATVGIDSGHVAGSEVYLEVLRRDLGWWLLLALGGAAVVGSREATPLEEGPRSAWALATAWAVAPTLLLLLSASKLPWYIYPALPGYAMLVALGADAVRERVRAVSPFASAAVVAILVLALVPRFLARGKRVTTERPEQVTMRALADLASADAHRVVVLDRGGSGAEGIREWHWFYFRTAARKQLGVDPPLAPPDCPLLVTPRPAEASALLNLAAAPQHPVYRVTATEPSLWIVDGCGGEVDDELGLLRVPSN